MNRTPSASSYTIHILVTLRGVLGEVDPGPEHATDVGVSLVEAFVDDGIYEWRTCRIENQTDISIILILILESPFIYLFISWEPWKDKG